MQTLYFAYGSNMNTEQMAYRCPAAIPLGAVRLEDYRLAFRGAAQSAVATVLPKQGSHVDGVLWRITSDCEHSLDRYEGYPNLYGKEQITVTDGEGCTHSVMVYTMNAPHRDRLGIPSFSYAEGILNGAAQNGIDTVPIQKAVERAGADYHGEHEQLTMFVKPRKRNFHSR